MLNTRVPPVLRAHRTLFITLGAEVRGALQVDQLVLPHWPDVNVFGNQLLTRPHGTVNYFGGRQVLALQVNGNLPQVLQASPAGPDGAGARHTVAFTLHHQRLSQYLHTRTRRRESLNFAHFLRQANLWPGCLLVSQLHCCVGASVYWHGIQHVSSS